MEFRDGHIQVRTESGAEGAALELSDEARVLAQTLLEACPMTKDPVSVCITLYFGEPFPAEEK